MEGAAMQTYRTRNLGFGLGSLEQRDASWKYRFRATVLVNDKHTRKQLGVTIGRISEMSEDQAIAACHSYRVNFRASAVSFLKPDDIPLAKEFLSPGAPERAAHFGAVGEQVAIANLLARGLEVFRNVNRSGCVDLVVIDRQRRLFRVEVKSGDVVANGTKHQIWRKVLRAAEYDVLAVVTASWKIYYFDPRNEPISFTRDGISEFISPANKFVSSSDAKSVLELPKDNNVEPQHIQ